MPKKQLSWQYISTHADRMGQLRSDLLRGKPGFEKCAWPNMGFPWYGKSIFLNQHIAIICIIVLKASHNPKHLFPSPCPQGQIL